MTSCFPRLLSPLLALALAGCAGAASTAAPMGGAPPPSAAANDTAGVLAAQRGWWHAFTVGDTAYLQAHSAPAISLTLSNGRMYDRAGVLARAATHVNGGSLRVDWAEEAVHVPAPGVAVVTSHVTESNGPRSSVFRYLTVLERGGAGWRVSMGQTTREAAATPNVSAEVAGPLDEYAGEYRTPRGGVVRVEVRGSALSLIDPSGQAVSMEPIGPAVFEYRSLDGINTIVRFVFTRDATGRVASLVRLATGEANTWSRVP
jgi:hypothetical protein